MARSRVMRSTDPNSRKSSSPYSLLTGSSCELSTSSSDTCCKPRLRTPERADLSEQLEESLLRQIFRFRRIAGHAQAKRIHAASMRVKQFFKRKLVAPLSARDKLRLGGLRRCILQWAQGFSLGPHLNSSGEMRSAGRELYPWECAPRVGGSGSGRAVRNSESGARAKGQRP